MLSHVKCLHCYRLTTVHTELLDPFRYRISNIRCIHCGKNFILDNLTLTEAAFVCYESGDLSDIPKEQKDDNNL